MKVMEGKKEKSCRGFGWFQPVKPSEVAESFHVGKEDLLHLLGVGDAHKAAAVCVCVRGLTVGCI